MVKRLKRKKILSVYITRRMQVTEEKQQIIKRNLQENGKVQQDLREMEIPVLSRADVRQEKAAAQKELREERTAAVRENREQTVRVRTVHRVQEKAAMVRTVHRAAWTAQAEAREAARAAQDHRETAREDRSVRMTVQADR